MSKENKKKLSLGDIIKKLNETSLSSQSDSSHASAKETIRNESKERDSHVNVPLHSSRNQTGPLYNSSSEKIMEEAKGQSTETMTIPRPDPAQTSDIDPNNPAAVMQANPSSCHSHYPSSVPLMASITSKDIDDEEEFDIFRYISIVIRRKEIVILAVIVMGILSTVSFFKSPKFFKTSARLLFGPDTEPVVGQTYSWRYFLDQEKNFFTHLELLKSNIVLKRVVQNLDIDIRPQSIAGNLSISQGKTDGEPNYIIELGFKHESAQIARDVLNELCREYIEYRREVNSQEDTRLIMKLETQIEKLNKELQKKEDALKRFKETYRMIELSSEANLVTSKLTTMEIALQETQLDLLETKERVTTLKSQIGQQETDIIQSMTYQNPIQAKLTELELELNTLSAEYSPDHFKIKTISNQIEKLKKALESEIAKSATSETFVKNPIRQSLLQTFINQNIEISALEAKRIAQERIIEKLNIEMKKLPSLEQEFAFLNRETKLILQTLGMLKVKYEEAKIKRDSKEVELKILELAQLPKHAIASKGRSSIFIGMLVGLIIGIALVFLIDYLDQTFKEPSDVEKILETPLIGVVPLIETEHAIVNTQNLTKSMLEPFRVLRANVKHISSQHRAKIFMMCSAVKGEGKTTLATNLAITFAMDKKRVILIDCDLRRSQVHSLLHIEKEPGLADYLLNTKSVDEIIKPTKYEYLSVITAGQRPHNPAELLGVPQFSQLLDTIRSRADIIICDSPALIPVSDSMTMAPYMDCCIMVVRALWTPTKAAHQAKSQLARIGSKLGGSILNAISHSKGYYPYYYGYYGYYAYKYSYEYDEEPKKRFSIRQWGLDAEKALKMWIQKSHVLIPRTVSFIGTIFYYITKKWRFWILLLLLGVIVSVRYYIKYVKSDWGKEFISLIENKRNKDSNSPSSPITVTGSPQPQSNRSSKLASATVFNPTEQVNRWLKAYNAADTSKLFQLYDHEDFEYPDGNFQQWRRDIIEKLSHSYSRSSVSLMNDVTSERVNANYYKTAFLLKVVTFDKKLFVKKTMIWKKTATDWRIIREKDTQRE